MDEKPLNLFSFENKKYFCPKCGDVEWYIDVSIPGFEGKYCQRCYAKWIKENFPLLQEIKGDTNGKKEEI